MTIEELEVKRRFEAIERLKQNDDFKYIFEFYLDEWTLNLVDNQNLESKGTIDRLKFRQNFKMFIYDIINEYEKLNQK
jgi:hypothetical protein